VAEADRPHRQDDTQDPEATGPTVGTVGATDDPKPGTEVAHVKLFDFEGTNVRIQVREGNPWFILVDVCKVLGIANASQAAQPMALRPGRSGYRLISGNTLDGKYLVFIYIFQGIQGIQGILERYFQKCRDAVMCLNLDPPARVASRV
jgi:hypothetical protein